MDVVQDHKATVFYPWKVASRTEANARIVAHLRHSDVADYEVEGRVGSPFAFIWRTKRAKRLRV